MKKKKGAGNSSAIFFSAVGIILAVMLIAVVGVLVATAKNKTELTNESSYGDADLFQVTVSETSATTTASVVDTTTQASLNGSEVASETTTVADGTTATVEVLTCTTSTAEATTTTSAATAISIAATTVSVNTVETDSTSTVTATEDSTTTVTEITSTSAAEVSVSSETESCTTANTVVSSSTFSEETSAALSTTMQQETSTTALSRNSWYSHQVQVPEGYGFWAICQNLERLQEFCVYNAVLPTTAQAGVWYDVPPSFPLAVESQLQLCGVRLGDLFPNKENLGFVLDVNPGYTAENTTGTLIVPPSIPVAGDENAVVVTTVATTSVARTTSTAATTTATTTTSTPGTTATTTASAPGTTATTTTTAPATTEATIASSMRIETLPAALQQKVDAQLQANPYLRIGVGVYALDGSIGYEYNANQAITSACTVKAVFARYVMLECAAAQTNLWTTTLTYEKRHRNEGSGVIKNNFSYGEKLSVAYLVQVLLYYSDNTAYNMLWEKYGGATFAKWLKNLGGQNLFLAKWGSEVTWPLQYGYCTVHQRATEWLGTYSYVTSPDADAYAQILKKNLTCTPYCYACDWLPAGTTWLHKSGWSDGAYNSAADAAVVNGKYLVVIITDEDKPGVSPAKADGSKCGNANVVRSIGRTVYDYVMNGTIKLSDG